MIRIELSSGESQLLMTSLLDTLIYPIIEFKELYYKRWKIETYYNRFQYGKEKGFSYVWIPNR